MEKAMHFALVAMFVSIVGYAMLAGGEHPVRVLLILAGLLLPAIRINAIMDRARVRRGGTPRLVSTTSEFLADVTALTRRDWQELALTFAASFGLLIAGFAAFSGAA